ncbi:MAG TPA: phage major capsid protein [Candidatus Acidoferrum sp.]|nr:phage major capsid protein [Candidatus Acidoferrum sp.]
MSNRITVINQTYQELRGCIEQAEQLASKPSLSPQEIRLHATLLAKISMLKQGISADELRRAELERLAQLAGEESPEAIIERAHKTKTPESEQRAREWMLFHKHGEQGEQRADFKTTSQWGRPQGAQTYTDPTSTGTGAVGGYLVPAGFQDRLFAAMATYDEILDDGNSTVWNSDNGAGGVTPCWDDTGTSSPVAFTKSTRLGETVQGSVNPVRFRAVNWSSTPTYRTGIVLVPYEMEQDSFMAFGDILEKVFQQRHKLAYGADCMTGSGVGAVGGVPTVPQGLLTAIPASAQQTSASSTLAITDLENLYNALPKVYRPNAKFYMTDNTRLLVHKLFESSTRSGWGFNGELLFNSKVVVCRSMTDWSAGVSNAIVYASPDYLMQRRVKNGSYVRRYTQLANYSEYGLYGYEGFMRADFRPVLFDAFQPPVASLNAHV